MGVGLFGGGGMESRFSGKSDIGAGGGGSRSYQIDIDKIEIWRKKLKIGKKLKNIWRWKMVKEAQECSKFPKLLFFIYNAEIQMYLT